MKWIREFFKSKKSIPQSLSSETEEFLAEIRGIVAESRKDGSREIGDISGEIKEAGSKDGIHYTDNVEKIKQLKREGKHKEAIDLLLQSINLTESESKTLGEGWGVAPWYYEQLAIIYRKEKRYDKEVEILELYEKQPKARGVGPAKLEARLKKAKELLAKSQ